MSKLHELLAAEKTVNAAWNTMLTETLKKFGNEHFFKGHTKSLKMLDESAQNAALEDAAKEHKEVVTNVYDTLDYALDIFANAENLQYQKNKTNQKAVADVVFRGEVIFSALPVDQLLGLEARIAKIREVYLAMPTLDAAKRWQHADGDPKYIFTSDPEHTTKTEKEMTPVILAPATDKHPAQVKEATKDKVVGKFTKVDRSGAATAEQKAEAIKRIDELLVEIKKARMRANETEVVDAKIGEALKRLLLEPLTA